LRANEKIAAKLAEKRDPRVIPEEAQGASLTFTVNLLFRRRITNPYDNF
jgi:hypothetical protein